MQTVSSYQWYQCAVPMALRSKTITVQPAEGLNLERPNEKCFESEDSLPLQLQNRRLSFGNLHPIPAEESSKGTCRSSQSSVKDEVELNAVTVNQIRKALHSLRVLVIVFLAVSVISLALNIWVISSVRGASSVHDCSVNTPQKGIQGAFFLFCFSSYFSGFLYFFF